MSLVLGFGCGGDDGDPVQESDASSGAAGSSTTDGGTTGSSTTSAASTGSSSTTAGPDVDEDAAHEFLTRIPGLWIGPVDSETSVGDFPTMNMDMRAADGRVLFSRIDLDPDNSLRFAFTFEEHGGQRQLVFRNGGEFLGLLRDTRTLLNRADPEAGTWTFCALDGGCGYVEATFTFDGEDSLLLDVQVMTMMHFDWPATRRQTRATPAPFPVDGSSGAPDDPFPPMPTLNATLTWTDPLPEGTSVWLILGTQPCALEPASCAPSRFMRVDAEAGATQADVVLEQIHPGQYAAQAVLDRNGNLGAGALLPDSGDLIAVDVPLTIDPSGETDVEIDLSFELP